MAAMVKKVVTTVELTDDIDGGKADRTLTFAWDGTNYEIDLSKRNATALEKTLKPYIDAGRRVRKTARRGAGGPGAGRDGRRDDLAQVRSWARSNGYDISDRGRVPAAVLEAYDGAS
jgi:hypothetical protein